jgi:hypothetical protein
VAGDYRFAGILEGHSARFKGFPWLFSRSYCLQSSLEHTDATRLVGNPIEPSLLQLKRQRNPLAEEVVRIQACEISRAPRQSAGTSVEGKKEMK